MNDLNILLKERWKKENGITTYIKKSAANESEALLIITNERRKELPFTGNLRWEDLRRLNLDVGYAKVLIRLINSEEFKLEPNSPKYVFPIPPVEMNLHKITQNIR